MLLFDWPRFRSSRVLRISVPDNLLASLRLGWVLLVIWGEIGVFLYALFVCRWPRIPHSTTRPTHVLLVADAQVPMPPSPSHSQTSTGLFHDIYTRRAWKVTRHLHPHLVIFLGDMLRSGRSIESDGEFSTYVQHFKDFFPFGPGVEVKYVPGNVDVGLGVSNSFSKHVRQRYERHFGAVNQHLSLANHSLILLDAPGIVDEDYARAGHGTSFEEWIPLRDGAIEFVKGLAEEVEEQLGPVILISHIPLHRAESKTCGPLRERGTIHRGVGHGWQRTLGKQTSSFLLQSLRPLAVFSADDRDYCDVTHALPGSNKEIHEVTVKSFSSARHITQPGFHLLTLYPGPTPSHAHAPCLLPRAEGTFTRLYIPAMGLTVIIILIARMQRARRAARLRLATTSPLPSHVECTQLSPPLLPPLPSPYSASSAYSYSYAYTNTPPNSQRGRDSTHFELPKRLDLGGYRTSGASRQPPQPPPASLDHDEGEQDSVRAHYLYVPPASPLPGDLLARRHSARASSPVTAVTGSTRRAWSFTYTFMFRGRRRRIAVHAPAWWRTGARRKGNELWTAVGRDFVKVTAPALITWVALVWWYSS